jgi:phosphoadenosine phosphosulfate reductase
MSAASGQFLGIPTFGLADQETVSQFGLGMIDTTVEEHRTKPSRGLPKPGSAFRKLEPTTALLDELRAASQRLETATPEEIIAWGVEHYAPYLTMATAFGPEGCVILSMLAKIAPNTYVFNLETGYQFQETLDLRDRIAEQYGLEVDLLQPELSVLEYEALHGGPLYRTNPNQCCFDRKIKTLQRASQVMHAWMSGIRRDQSADRAQAAIVGWDKKFGLVKISPLANWTKKDVWKRIMDEGIPYNPLHDKGYPSIGCWPCTRAVEAGETDERAGRWSGMRKTECGLHSIAEQDGSGI